MDRTGSRFVWSSAELLKPVSDNPASQALAAGTFLAGVNSTCVTWGPKLFVRQCRYLLERTVSFRTERKTNSVVQDNTQEGFVDVDLTAAVLDEAEVPEFVHEEIDSAARRSYHFRQSLLRHSGNHCFGPICLTIAS
jgi:hypothetical protein